MDALVISPLATADEALEIVERKSLGHPDSICDALLKRFRAICAASIEAALVKSSITMSTRHCSAAAAPWRNLVAAACLLRSRFTWLGGRYPRSEVLRFPYPKSPSRDHARGFAAICTRWMWSTMCVFTTSCDLARTICMRCSRGGAQSVSPLANDTSIGVGGYAPLSPLERLVLAIETGINGRDRANEHP